LEEEAELPVATETTDTVRTTGRKVLLQVATIFFIGPLDQLDAMKLIFQV
jgi:hypothetical protein